MVNEKKFREKKFREKKISYIKPLDRVILIAVFVMFIVLIAGVRIGTQSYKESQIVALQDFMDILAETQKAQFERYVSEKISLLQGWATFPEIYEMDTAQQEAFIKGRSKALGFHHIFIIREDGMGIYIEENTIRDQRNEIFYENVMKQDIYITEPFYGGDAVTMTISVSIRDADGEKVGALCGAIDLNELQRMFSQNRMFMKGFSYLINSDGAYIASTDMNKVYDKETIYEEDGTDSSLISEAFAQSADMSGVMVQDDVEYLANITYLKDYDWVIVQGISMEEIFKGVRYIDDWYYFALAIIVVLIVCVARIIFYWNRNNCKINTDTLTGCRSRAAMQNLLEYLEHIYKYDITVIYFDLNYFKQINDTYGHEQGDKILCLFAKTLMEVFDRWGQVGRMGGDEFMVVLRDVPEEETRQLCRQLSERLTEQKRKLDFACELSTSYGFATRKQGSREPLDNIIIQADQNMYRFKEKYR